MTKQINFLECADLIEYPSHSVTREQFRDCLEAWDAAMKIVVQLEVPLKKDHLRRDWNFIDPVTEALDALPFTWTQNFHNRWDDNLLTKHWISTICVTPTPKPFSAITNTFAGKARTLEQSIYAAIMRCADYIQNNRDAVTPPDDAPIAA